MPANSWAYDAINQLAADGIIEGYPDKTFKGNRPLTRYEAAVLTERAVKKLEAELADVKTAQDVQQKDIDAVKKLLDEYGNDIKGLQTDVAQLKADDASTKAILARQQFHLYYFLRAPGTLNYKIQAYAAPGVPVPAGVLIPKFGSNPGQQGQWTGLHTGSTGLGTGYQTLRMVFRGTVDDHVSYGIRLEDRYYFVNSLGESAVTPGAGTYPSNGLLRINYAYVRYTDKQSGLDLTGGRYIQGEGPDDLGLNYADYFNGALLHYNKGALDLAVGYGNNDSTLSNTNATVPSVINNQNAQYAIIGSAALTLAKKYNVGVSYEHASAWPDEVLWNPFTGVYTGANTPITTGSGWLQATLNPNLKVEFEALHRFGKDPFTLTNWNEPDAYWAQVNIGDSIGHKGNNYADLGAIDTGFNSVGPDTNVTGTTGYQQFYLGNPNGNRVYYAGIHHWVGDNARIGLVYQHYGLKPGTDEPVVGSAYISGFSANALFLETLLSF
ncbi:MAG: S-layer homology domain-containing protein [Vulcanimicrobiaceae bacterium]